MLDNVPSSPVNYEFLVGKNSDTERETKERERESRYVYVVEVTRGFVCGRRRDTRYPSFEQRAGIKTDSSSSASSGLWLVLSLLTRRKRIIKEKREKREKKEGR